MTTRSDRISLPIPVLSDSSAWWRWNSWEDRGEVAVSEPVSIGREETQIAWGPPLVSPAVPPLGLQMRYQ